MAKLLETLSARLTREHKEALLKDYSADYETWLEDRVAQLEAGIRRAVSICEDPTNRSYATINQKCALLDSIRSELLKVLGGKS